MSISEHTTLGELDRNMELGELAKRMRKAGLLSGSGDYSWDDEDDGSIFSTLVKIKDTLVNIDRTLTGMTEHWIKVDEAAAKYAKAIGTTVAGMNSMRDSAIKSAVKGKIGFDFGMNAEDLVEAQTNYMKGIGRNVKLGMEDSKTLAAVTKVFKDNLNVDELFDSFDKLGVSMEGVGDHMYHTFKEASKSGLSLEKYAKNVQQGLAMAQTYTFRGGLKSMEVMAKRATAIRMEMSQISSFADKFSTIEDAIQNSARLQVLGGSFAGGADALGLLNDSISDLESLEKRIEGFTAGKSTFNRATGEVETSAFNRLRLKEYANITGQDFNKVMEVSQRQAIRGEIESQLLAANNGQIDKDFKELILNTATIKNGKAGVTIGTEFKELSELRAEDQEELIKETQDQSADIKDIARNVRSLTEIREGIKKQYESVAAQQEAPLGQVMKGVTSKFRNNFALRVTHFFLEMTLLAEGFKKIGGIWKRSGSSVAEGMDSANAILRRKGAKGLYTKAGPKIYNEAGERIYGAAAKKRVESVGLKVAKKKATSTVAKKAAKEATEEVVKKTVAKEATKKVGSKLLTGVAKGGGVGIIGAVGNIATDILVDTGKMKKGGAAHTAMKVGSSALEGAGAGMMAGAALGSIIPGFGTAVGAIVGATAGVVAGVAKMNKIKKELVVDNQLAELGIERKGKYRASQLKDIDKALQTGEISNKLRNKLLKEGDTDILKQINTVKDKNAQEKESRRERRQQRREQREEAKKKFGTANIEVTNAYLGGKEFSKVLKEREGTGEKMSSVLKKGVIGAALGTAMIPGLGTVLGGLLGTTLPKIIGKKETGESKELSTFEMLKKKEEARLNEEKNKIPEKQKIDINLTGTIKLEAPDGYKMDITKELKNNPRFISEITDLVSRRLNVMNHGAYVEHKQHGNN